MPGSRTALLSRQSWPDLCKRPGAMSRPRRGGGGRPRRASGVNDRRRDTMKRTAFTMPDAVRLLAAAVPAAQAAEQGPRISALHVRVNDKVTGDVKFYPIEERIPLESGREYRISLDGVSPSQRAGIGVHAHFAEAAGKGN